MFFRIFLLAFSITGIARAADVVPSSRLLLSIAAKKTAVPTKAYLSQCGLRNIVSKTWREQLKSHHDMIHNIVVKEEKFADTHHVFYHAQCAQLMGFQDLLKISHERVHKRKITDFIFLRSPRAAALQKTSVSSFLQQEGRWAYDMSPRNRNRLLSVNLSLFGNAGSVQDKECSFDYFLNDFSVAPPEVGCLLLEIQSAFGCDYPKMSSVSSFLERDGAPSLLQIFVPKEEVDRAVYISAPLGCPILSVEQMESAAEYMTSSILDSYCCIDQNSEGLSHLYNFILAKYYLLLSRTGKPYRFRAKKPARIECK